VGRTLLSDAFDVGVDLAAAVGVEAARVGRTLLSDAFDVEVDLAVAVGVEAARVGRTLLSDAFDVGVDLAGCPILRALCEGWDSTSQAEPRPS
jgi:hypothetical protein